MITGYLSWRIGLGLILGFWLAVGLFLDYPAPFIDDLYFIGAGLNLAQHGSLINPLSETLAGRPFFGYMPVESYVLAGWFSLFGISTLSLHILFTLLSAAISLLLYRLLPHGAWSWLAATLIAAATFGLLGGAGLRTDALGLFFLLAGLDTWRAASPWGFFWRNLFLGLAVITFPSVALPAFLFSLAGLLHGKLFKGQSIHALAPAIGATAAAYLTCFLLFLLCIGGRLSEFLPAFLENQGMGATGVRERFQLFTALGISKWVVTQVGFLTVAGVLLVRWKKTGWGEGIFFLLVSLVIFILLAIASLNSASGAHLWAFACLMAVLFLLLHEKAGPAAWTTCLIVFAIAAFGHAHVAIQHLLASRPISAEQRGEILARVTDLHPARLYVDAYASRELFDYRLPPGTLAFEGIERTHWSGPTTEAGLPANSVLVVSEANFIPTQRQPKPSVEARPLCIFGRPVPGVIENPYDLEVIDHRD